MAQKTNSFWLRWDWRFSAGSPAVSSSALVEPAEQETLPPPRPDPPAEERRNAVRHPCGLGVSCQPIILARVAPWPAVIQDVSATGIALALDHPLPVGAFLALRIPLSGGVQLVRARVIGNRAQPDGGWVLGCTLARELPADQLRTLIQ